MSLRQRFGKHSRLVSVARSRESGIDLERLRRRAAFERLLVRLDLGAPNRWVVKGGMALEIRLGDRARSTRDLDLALRDVQGDGSTVRDLLIDCLSPDPEEDAFEFRVGEPTTITLDEAGRPGWRFPVEARMAGRRFANVRLDVVARDDEVAKTQRIELPGVLDFAGLERHEVEIVDPRQHFAEKVHAFTRTYGERPNTRVRDLPDMVLLIDEGWRRRESCTRSSRVFSRQERTPSCRSSYRIRRRSGERTIQRSLPTSTSLRRPSTKR